MTAPDGPDEDFWLQLTTRTGWRLFTSQDEVEPPKLLTQAAYDLLDEDEQDDNNEDRLDYHARLQVVATSTVRRTVNSGSLLMQLNKQAISARRGLLVSGPANTGKTIALTRLGLTYELRDRRRHPGQDGRIPVIYVTVPPAATARMIAAEFARFLDIPLLSRWNITDMMEAVVGVCTKARTGLVLVDEIHNISLNTRHGAEASDTLKYFSERIPATFAYAGIDISTGSLLSGTRGDQIAGRFTEVPTHPFPFNQEWKGLIAQMEGTLLLREHKPGTLTGLARFIHTRTGGMIGTLSHQIRGAAVNAILDKTEKITKTGLLAVDLDIASRRKKPGSGQ